MSSIARNFSWNLGAQATTAAATLVVVPFVIARLGIDRFGVYSLAVTSVALLSQFDGGLVGTTMRYLAIDLGRGDRAHAARVWVTTLAVTATIGVAVGAVVALAAHPLVSCFDMPARLRPDAVVLTYAVAALVPLTLVFGVAQAAVQARGDFRLVSVVTVTTSLARTLGVLACTAAPGRPLRWVALLLVAQQAVAVVALAPAVARHLPLRGARPLGRAETRELLAYSGKVQLFSLSYLVNMQSDAFVVGLVAPIGVVGMYSAGANVALQVRGVFSNAVSPMGVRLADELGRRGPEGARAAFVDLQRRWVAITSVLFAALVPASLFMVEAWLGAKFWRAAVICALLLGGYAVNMLTAPLTLYCHGVGAPGVEARYGLWSMALNAVLTVALVAAGTYGVVAATAAATIAGSLLLVPIARRHVDRGIEAFGRLVPVLPCLLAAAVALGLGALVEPHGPHGVAGVAVAAAYVLPAAAVGLVARFGRRAVLDRGRRLLAGASA